MPHEPTDNPEPVTRDEVCELIAAVMHNREQVEHQNRTIVAMQIEFRHQTAAALDLVRIMRKTCDAFAAAIDDYEQTVKSGVESRRGA